MTPAKGLKGLPVSVFAAVSRQSGQGIETSTELQTTELLASDGFTLSGERRGGYYIELHTSYAPNSGGSAGDLEDAYVALPIGGARGQLSLIVGQASPLLFQADPMNFVTDSIPVPLATTAGDVSLAMPMPMVRLDYFAGRGSDSANGNYVSVGLPFSGTLALNSSAHVGAEDGVFTHVFHREGYTTAGVIGYSHGSDSLGGLLGSYGFGDQVLVTVTGTEGHDSAGRTRQAAVESEYDATPWLGFVGRWETGSFGRPFPVAAINFYPGNLQYLRLSAETVQQPGLRTTALTARLQF